MRVRITQKLTGSIDGIQLDPFEPGRVYDVGTLLGCYLMAIQAAEPVGDEPSALVLPMGQRFFASPTRTRSTRGLSSIHPLRPDAPATRPPKKRR
jgi:hypothetical protein